MVFSPRSKPKKKSSNGVDKDCSMALQLSASSQKESCTRRSFLKRKWHFRLKIPIKVCIHIQKCNMQSFDQTSNVVLLASCEENWTSLVPHNCFCTFERNDTARFTLVLPGSIKGDISHLKAVGGMDRKRALPTPARSSHNFWSLVSHLSIWRRLVWPFQ